ncbi:Beta-glucosidase 1 [Sphaceloma murrayae]|uniref:Beta-glucosidase 1 n=1 Tax=Sphaceloma murrayae TaxID=2082308 RepID=A0A2K1QPX2_9PEZI|nr:Beta-glucosidase 1 [Sphaceloma murrayae]
MPGKGQDIRLWIDDVCSKTSGLSEGSANRRAIASPPPSRKRRRVDSVHAASSLRSRQKRIRGAHGDSTVAPSQMEAEDAAMVISIPGNELEDRDDHATPRARDTKGSKKRNAEDETTSRSRKSLKSSSTAASGASSPVKANILRSIPAPIVWAALESSHFDKQTDKLVDTIQEHAGLLNLASTTLANQLRKAYPKDVQLRHDITYKAKSARSKLGDEPTTRELGRIISEAKVCRDRKDNETTWNSMVHGPLFSLATDLSKHRGRVYATDVTRARINHQYMPLTPSNVNPLGGKVVDFVLYLSPSPATEAAYRHLDWVPNHGCDFNHINHNPTAESPIAISVETKIEGEGLTEGYAQLSTWVAAHFNKLEQLTTSGSRPTKLPVLPLLFIQGPSFFCYLASRSTSGDKSVTTIHEKIDLGDVTTASGLCKVLSALLVLIDWAETIYRPWFESSIKHWGK